MNATPESPISVKNAVERTVEIEAPVGTVWKALTDARELERWFPLEARVEPGPDGTIHLAWDEGRDISRIEIWEPNRHLRTRGTEGFWVEICTDYFLEGHGGSTTLRVVTSGFSDDADWDEFVGAFGRGWDFELGGLKHALERHPGTERIVARTAIPYTIAHDLAWERILQGLSGGEIAGLEPGATFHVTVAGHKLSGRVRLNQPPYQFVGLVENWNDALFRVELFGMEGKNRAMIWLSTYGVPADRVGTLESDWRGALPSLVEP